MVWIWEMYNNLSGVSGCNYVIVENCALLCYYAASSGDFLQAFRDNLSVPSSGFKNLEPWINNQDFLTLRMGLIGYLKHQWEITTTHRVNNPEDCSSQLLRGESLKSRICHIFLLSAIPYFDCFIYGHRSAHASYMDTAVPSIYRIYPNARWLSRKHVCQVKMFLSKFKITPPINKMAAEKKYFTVNFIHLIHVCTCWWMCWDSTKLRMSL
jgi:hypothetical protein